MNRLESAEIKAARLRQAIRADCHRYVRRHVLIESPDAPGGMVPFVLWPAQEEALAAFIGKRLIVACKARQLGLTWLALGYTSWREIHQPGYTVVALSRGEDEAKELVRRQRFILERLPRWLARHHKDAPKGWPGPIWEAQAQQITIYHGREPDARFLAEAASRDSGRSFTASTVLIDEWAYQQWAREIWQAAYPTINRPTGGQVIGLSTAKPATQFHEIWVGAEHEWRRPDAPANGFYGVFLPWTADPRRTPEWYEATKAALPATYRAEYPATPDEAFSCGQDLAFPEFDFNVHTCEPFEIPVGWSRYRGLDWGFAAPFAALWAAVDYDGTLIVYREWYQNRLHVPEVAAGILDRSKEETFAGSVADPSIWARAGHSGPSIGEDFGKHGLWWCKADNDRLQGWAAVHQRLRVDPETGKPAIRIFRTCKNLIRELGHAMQDPHRAEDVETNQSDHALDSLRYICLARPYAPSKPKEPEPWWLKKAERKPFNWRAQL